MKAGVDRCTVCLMKCWNNKLYGIIKWDGLLSTQFTIKSGMQQRGVCSSWIFNLFMDELINMLHERGPGCFFKSLLVGCILYADDLLLLSGQYVNCKVF